MNHWQLCNAPIRRTTTKTEPSNTNTRRTASNDVDSERFELRVNVVPNEAGADVNGLRARVVHHLREAGHRDLDSRRRREARVGSMTAAFHLCVHSMLATGLPRLYETALTAKGVRVAPTIRN